MNSKVTQFDLIEPSELCPEDEENVLIITKQGTVTIGQYVAVDENSAEWINNDSLSDDLHSG